MRSFLSVFQTRLATEASPASSAVNPAISLLGVPSMSIVSIAYFSGYGHTAKQAEGKGRAGARPIADAMRVILSPTDTRIRPATAIACRKDAERPA
jgi:hypothetical protein